MNEQEDKNRCASCGKEGNLDFILAKGKRLYIHLDCAIELLEKELKDGD